MRISFASLLGWLAVTVLLVAAIGAGPAYALRGWAGLREQAIACSVVLIAMVLAGAAVVAAASNGPRLAAMTFILAGFFGGMIALGVAAVVGVTSDLHAMSLVLWVGIFFFPLILAESFWLSRSLRRAMRRKNEAEEEI